jgi:hypothetical protein
VPEHPVDGVERLVPLCGNGNQGLHSADFRFAISDFRLKGGPGARQVEAPLPRRAVFVLR